MKRAAYFATAMALAAILAGPALARVGVVSVTDGGSSVQQGSELQIGQRVTTGSDGRVNLMFVDGSAVTVGSNSVVAVENYAYDPGSKRGALALHVEQGTVRFVGGAISKTADAQIRTPSSMIGIRGGIAAVTVGNGGATTADFLHGSAMHVSGRGITQTATRSGSQISVPAGGQPSLPTVLAAGQLTTIRSLDRAPSAAQGTPAGRMAGPAVDSAFAKYDLGKHNPTPGAMQPRSPGMPSTIAQAPTQAVQTSQQQFGQQQFVGLLAAKPPTLPAAIPAPTPVAVSIPASPSPVPAAPAAPAVKPAPAGGTSVSFGFFGMSSGATTTMMGGSCCGAIFVSGSMSGSGSLTKSGTGGSTTITGTK